jgi:hypothetical protein
VVGLSEGLQGSSLNSGNFESAMRRFADLTGRPWWASAFASLATIITVPRGSELWYSDSDIPALKDDIKDAAEVRQLNAQAIRTLVDGGFEPDSVVDAINAGDLKRLKHTGKTSVQLQPPLDENPKPEPTVKVIPAEEAKQIPAETGRVSDMLDYIFVRYSPDQTRVPKGDPAGGQFGYAGGLPGLQASALMEASREGGFSVTVHGNVPTGGFMVSPYPDAEEKIPLAELTRDAIDDYRDRHLAELKAPEHYLGGWVDGDQVYLDIAVHTRERGVARRLARKYNQLAYFDLASGETVYLDKGAAA